MFGTSNSIEQASPVRPVASRRPEREEPPIREATPAEVRAMKSKSAPTPAPADDVASKHGFYTTEKRATRVYYSDYQQKTEVMRADPARISTKLDDRQTVSAMLDLAQSRGWQSVNIRGSESFKRETWVQAQVRGMDTQGYQPKETDLQEAERRKQAAKPVEKPAQAQSAPAVKAAQPAAKAAPAAQVAKQAAQKAPKAVQVSAGTPPAPAPAQPAQARQAAVWGSVEAQGKQARQDEAAAASAVQKPAQKPAAVAA